MPLAEQNGEPPLIEDEEIVVSGLSGIFPACHNVKEFAEKLYSHKNLVIETPFHWSNERPDLPPHIGKVPDLDRFDAQFFMVKPNLARIMDVMSRKLLEQVYQAMFDAGVSTNEVSGRKVGVYVGVSLTESEQLMQDHTSSGTGIMGCNRSMFANRVSYWLNIKGPSMTIDASCSASMVCLEKAYDAMKRGDCDAALVAGCNVHLNPQSCINFDKMFGTNSDGKTKCFDKYADGPSPSDCIGVIFLQKACDAKRIYASICNIKTQFGKLDEHHYDKYGPQRNPKYLSSFYEQFYKKLDISPTDVEYFEAFGSAFPEADKTELEAIEEIFCKHRNDSLYVGSVMSNMGYSIAATTIAALIKVCLAYQTGVIPANLHYNTPHNDIPAICDGRMRVVTDNTPFGRSYAAINSLSISGINGHLLLKGHYKSKVTSNYLSNIPYLLSISGRHEKAVEKIIEEFKTQPVEPEVIALLHNMHKAHIPKHLARAFLILGSDENLKTVCIKEKVDHFDVGKKPLWFVYSGMGSQWTGMGKELLRIPMFAAAIERCHKILEQKGIDLVHILTSNDKTIYQNVLNSFVGIAAVQIGLTDVLLSMGLAPDNIIGHSVGELGCAYADGCLTAEEMILAAYYRGVVSAQTTFVKGTMAAVGLGWKQIEPMCPPEIDVACHNSAQSCTISGPAEQTRNFVAKLTEQGIFAREVNSSNIAYHSRYIQDAGPSLLRYLKNVIKDPKPRSKRWLSTSVPAIKWDLPEAQQCSAEYQTNNLLNPVLFEETSKAIPSDAVLIEIAPHGLLQAILKRSLPSTCINIPLTRRDHPDNAIYLLEAIGELYMSGYNPHLSALYPKVEFPVSTETQSLSHLVEWAHGEICEIPVLTATDTIYSATYNTAVSTCDDEFSFLRGHIINGEAVYPCAAVLVLAWDTLAMALKLPKKSLSVKFHDVHFHAQLSVSDERVLKFGVQIHRGNGHFQVTNEEILVASGYVESTQEKQKFNTMKEPIIKNEELFYDTNDIYRIFHDRGYGYRGEFRSIQRVNTSLTRAVVTWNENWVTLIDAAIQMNILISEGDTIQRPQFIQQLKIDVKHHHFAVETPQYGTSLLAYFCEDENLTSCGGISLRSMLFTGISSIEKKALKLKTLKFVPFIQKDCVDISTALFTFLQIIQENKGSNLTGLDITTQENDSALSSNIKEVMPEFSSMKLDLKIMTQKHDVEEIMKMNDFDFLMADSILIIDELTHVIQNDTFVVVLDNGSVSRPKFRVVASTNTPNGRLVLGRWRTEVFDGHKKVISVTTTKDITQLKSIYSSLSLNSRLCILTNYPPICELKDLVRKWNENARRSKICMAMVPTAKEHTLETMDLPDFELAYSILCKGLWGGYYYARSGNSQSTELSNVTMQSATAGNLDLLSWIEAPELRNNGLSISVHYAGLSSHDVTKASGDVKVNVEDFRYGMDFSGLTASGDRVMGIVREAAVSSKVSAETSLLWPVPKHWTLEEAATVPLAYAHAFYLLTIKCNMTHGTRVMVYGATGGLGQAIITIALAHQCHVFAGVSNLRKKELLRNMFPDLPAENIGRSRDESFGDFVLTATKGEGCDIVVSCTKGDLINISLRCCAAFGATLDTQTVHSKTSFTYEMFNLTSDRSYFVTDFCCVFEPWNNAEREKLHLMVSEGIAQGYVRPLSHVTYLASDANKAMRLMATREHFGRVLLRMHDESLTATKRFAAKTSNTHLIISTSPCEAVAVRIIDLIVSRGAVSIVFHRQHKRDFNDGFVSFKKKQWRKAGANVMMTAGTLNDMETVENLINSANSPIDSIYILVEEAEKGASSLLATLDSVSREACSVLRTFAVISNSSTIGQNICINRTLNGFPALMLELPTIEEYTESKQLEEGLSKKNSILIRNVMPTIENALCSSEPVAVIQSIKQEESVIDNVLQFAIYEKNDSKTLAELGLNNERIQDVLQILQKNGIVISKERLPHITVAELKVFQNTIELDVKQRIQPGLEDLYNAVSTEELQAMVNLVYMPTAAHKFTMFSKDYDPNSTYLVMVPGIDGHYGKFQTLCERLKISAAVLQPGLDHIRETISEMALRLVKVMLTKICPKQKFYLLGYSFGVLVALEMAAVLEDHGLTGVVFCVDASPDTYPTALESWLRGADIINISQLQNKIVQHLHTLMTGSTSKQLMSQLEEATTWNDKVDIAVRALHDRISFSRQYARCIIEAAYYRICEARNYNSNQNRPLRSQIVLMRSESYPHISPDLHLARYSEQKPCVYELSSSHAAILEDQRCANIINRYLDKQIIDDFNKKNLCNTYLCKSLAYVVSSSDTSKGNDKD